MLETWFTMTMTTNRNARTRTTTVKRVNCELSNGKTVTVSLYGWSQTEEQREAHGDLCWWEIEEAWAHHTRLCADGTL